MKVTVLGCGTSSGVPMIGCHCPVCRSGDPRNKRRRCSILVEWRGQALLVDTGPDLRMQLLDADVDRLDAVLYTHAHADHVHGIDDLRALNNVMGAALPAYAHPGVLESIRARFGYAFQESRGSQGFWRPQLVPHPVEAPFRIGDALITPMRQRHGNGESWGLRFGPFAYSPDCDFLPEETFRALAGTEVWLVDALRDRPHPSHAHLARTLEWIERIAPRQAWLTHTNHEVDWSDWATRLPPGVQPAWDGLVIELPDDQPAP
jgi:phosphoribosyl 1,2-cyclic phosphate phosphodiesterase